ncbi:fumarylacetoacetate hydrolase family protein [Haloferax sp. ATB1]|uniref:fumarylacetoacetate hydrolase family protein n=1 Tax=Haloferax sp. ATB1 TaxID=1508454 RepID=UPI0005B1D7EF|nr:fumarylacetoacetate hydrolase family protein [Haloferax sp. ATB1]
MKLARYNGEKLGLVDGGTIIDITGEFELSSSDPLREFLSEGYDLSDIEGSGTKQPLSEIRLEAPVHRPGKIVAAPLNYEKHVAEMGVDMDIAERGYFLKAPSSLIGPNDTIELPYSDERFDYEVELAFIMGSDVKDIPAEEVWDNVLGYTILLDISLRGDQDRSNRKSFDTFTVVGPFVVTPDEVGDPQALDMELQLNGETRQAVNTDDMIYSCADIVQYASIGATIKAGDVVTTGTPSGVGELQAGDRIYAQIENIGSMEVSVTERDLRFADLDV